MYVEVTDAASAAGDDDVLKMKYVSPAMSKASTRERGSDEGQEDVRPPSAGSVSHTATTVASPPIHSTPIPDDTLHNVAS